MGPLHSRVVERDEAQPHAVDRKFDSWPINSLLRVSPLSLPPFPPSLHPTKATRAIKIFKKTKKRIQPMDK